MAALDNSLTTLARAKQILEISGTSKDAILTMLIAGASKFIETYCKRQFGRQTVSNELLSGRGGKRLYVKRAPIISGQTVTLERIASINSASDWETVDSNIYVVDYNAGCFILQNSNSWSSPGQGGVFTEGDQNYRASYVGGFYLPKDSQYQDGTDDDLDLPFDLEMGCISLVGNAFRQRKSRGIASQRVFQVQLTFSKGLQDDPDLKATLDSYRVMRAG